MDERHPSSTPERDEDRPADLSRRDLMKLGAAATLAVSLGGRELAAASASAIPAAQAPAAFFTPAEFAMVDELSELIIPTDEHSPGARAAKVAAYIDARLAEAWDEQDRTDWREGLRSLDALSRQMHSAPFMEASVDRRIAVLEQIAKNEKDPKTVDEKFFVQVKTRVIDAYYTSQIGMKQEMEYKGNVYLTEFVGTDVSGT